MDAWNNLGNVLVELGEHEDGLAAYQKALQVDPSYGDAHYNLADALEQLGRRRDARPHWQAYLRHDLTSQWAKHARSRLSQSG